MALIINQEIIPDELIEGEMQGIKAEHERMGHLSCCGREGEFRQQAVENIIARVLISQEAERRFPVLPEAEVRDVLERLINEHGGRGALFAHLGLEENQEELLLEEIRGGLRVDRLMLETWGAPAEPDEAEEQRFYKEHLPDYLTIEEIRASHLFKRFEKAEDRESAWQLLRGLRRRTLAGEDFDALALEHTDKEDKLVDLGWFARGEFSEEFDSILFSLEEGEISPVFRSHWGFHLARVTECRPPVPRPFTEVQPEIRERLTAAARQEKTRALAAALKAAAVIDESPPGAAAS